MLTTKQVAERLGVSQGRVRALIKVGRLPSQQFGRDHLIKESDLSLVANRRPGRPRKADAAAEIAPAVADVSPVPAPTAQPTLLPLVGEEAKKAA